MTAAALPTKPDHLPHLDGLRAVLAMFVVAAHCYPTVWPPMYGRFPTGIAAVSTGWLTLGYVPVEVFIVLSGYCLMLPVTGNGGRMRTFALGFYARRARRILPTFYAALAACLLLEAGPLGRATGTHWDICLPVTPGAVASNLFMVHDLLDLYKINHAFWSIAIEWRLYFTFPIVVWLFRKTRPGVAAVVMATAAVALAWQLPTDGPWWGIRKTVSFFALFVFGAFTASRPQWDRRPARAFAALATAVAVWQIWGWHCPVVLLRTTAREAGIGLAAAGWLAVWSSAGPSVTRRMLQWRPLPAIGLTAYSLYLIHPPVVQLVWQYGIGRLGLTDLPAVIALLLTAVPASVAVAYLFYLVAERPFLSRRQYGAAAVEMGPAGDGSA